jgi:hypothetical protein
VVELAGISSAELKRYKRPADFVDSGGRVPQPRLDGPGPHMSNYPPGGYEKLLSMSDADVLAMSENQPPVQVAAG